MNLFNNREIIGANLTAYIQLNGYTKTSILRLTGIARPSLDSILDNTSQDPVTYHSNIQRIADCLSLPLDYFLKTPTGVPPKQQEPVSSRSKLAQELLDDLDELITVSAFYINEEKMRRSN